MRYTAVGSRYNKYFELIDDYNSPLGSITYSGWTGIKTEIVIGNDYYKIIPVNIWRSKFQLSTNNEVIADLKFTWLGRVTFTMQDNSTYVFKPRFWHDKFSLLTADEKEVIVVRRHFLWSKLSLNYEIETDDNYNEGKSILLVLMAVYCCNQIRRRSASASV